MVELKKLKDLVEKSKAPRSGVQQPAEQKKGADVERIVERLRVKEVGEAELERRIAGIKAGIGEKKAKRKLDFRTVSFDAKAGGAVRFVGSFYRSFEAPIARIAGWLSKFPLAQTLSADLESAGLATSAEQYLVIATVVAMIIASLSFLLIATSGIALADLTLPLFALPIAVAIFLLVAISSLIYPSSAAAARGGRIDRDLPFALRHMATQISAGVGLHKSITSIANADYGAVSQDFRRMLFEMEHGASTEEALMGMSNRTRSKGLKKATIQMVRALRTGGNLSQIIGGIAEDVAFESRMKIRDFTEKLNMIGVVYVMLSVVAPVIVAILSSVLQIPMLGGSGIGIEAVAMVYLSILAVLAFILLFIRTIEPGV
jgi:flagellar protein FlaJ